MNDTRTADLHLPEHDARAKVTSAIARRAHMILAAELRHRQVAPHWRFLFAAESLALAAIGVLFSVWMLHDTVILFQ